MEPTPHLKYSRFPDTVSRLWKIFELWAQVRLRTSVTVNRTHGLRISNREQALERSDLKPETRNLETLKPAPQAPVFVVIVSKPCPCGPVSRMRKRIEKARPTKPSIEKIHIPRAYPPGFAKPALA